MEEYQWKSPIGGVIINIFNGESLFIRDQIDTDVYLAKKRGVENLLSQEIQISFDEIKKDYLPEFEYFQYIKNLKKEKKRLRRKEKNRLIVEKFENSIDFKKATSLLWKAIIK